MDVFRGIRTLERRDRVAIGLIQQALVDLNYTLGASGRRRGGVNRRLDRATKEAIRRFQTVEAVAGASPGDIDRPTLRCLDELRSRQTVPAPQGAVPPSQFQISGPQRGRRDLDIFFDRGSSALTTENCKKIIRVATAHRGCPLTLHGFVSEDELVDFGPALADNRIQAVDAELSDRDHDLPSTACPAPVPPLRTPAPHAAASADVVDYRSRRTVEIVPAGQPATTVRCPPGAPLFRPLSAAESPVLDVAITTAVDWMNAAIGKLTRGHSEGDPAVAAYFGHRRRRLRVRRNLGRWRDHLNTVVRRRNRHGTQCNPTCQRAIAFNQRRGPTAQMTVCPRFFGTFRIEPSLSQEQKRAFVVMHEAGHGSIGTRDTGYGHGRLIEFLAGYPAIALRNTDSYTFLVLCLNNFAGFCALPGAANLPGGLTGTQATKARRGLAWLEAWLTFGSQDLTGLYKRMAIARRSGRRVRDVQRYYARVFRPLIRAFEIRRPAFDPPPTFREQTEVAAIRDRILVMERASRARLTVTGAALRMEWATGGPFGGPGRRVFLADAYFLLSSDRQRVETLLPVIIAASSSIDASRRRSYRRFIRDNVRRNRGNVP